MTIKNKQKGFTLIEILVSIFVITVAFLSLEAFTVATIKTNNSAELRTNASNVAVSLLNEYEYNLPLTTISGLPTRQRYAWSINPTYITPTEVNLAVTVTWTDHGRVKTMIVNRLVTTYQGN